MASPLVFPSKHLQAALPPERYYEQILAIEAELDELHPPWKQPARSRMGPQGRGIVGSRGIQDVAVKARVKYLLQRRKHLYDGKDWEVVVKQVMDRSGNIRMLAMPIIPRAHHTPEDIQRMATTPAQPSIGQIAARLGIAEKTAKKLAKTCPPGEHTYHYVRRAYNAQVADEIEKAQKAKK